MRNEAAMGLFTSAQTSHALPTHARSDHAPSIHACAQSVKSSRSEAVTVPDPLAVGVVEAVSQPLGLQQLVAVGGQEQRLTPPKISQQIRLKQIIFFSYSGKRNMRIKTALNLQF